jgi:glycosyltransferase involved in cell wall biosynthesis
MQLGIYAPYNLSESTVAAIQLATLAISMDIRVAYLTTGERSNRVHDYWDQRVRSNPRKHIDSWAMHSDRCVWFVPHRRRLDHALQTRTNTSHILVPPWHQLQDKHLEWIHWYDHVACPSPEAEYRIAQTSGHLEYAAFNCPWPSGLTHTVRDGVWNPGQVKFFLPIGASTQKEHGGDILKLAEMLLTNHPNAHLTIAPSRTWPRDLKRRIGWLLGMFPSRFYCLPGLSLPERLQSARVHDCVLFLDTQVNLGVEVSQYKAVGLPVVTWEAEPASYMVEHGVNGVLVPCDVSMSVWGAERVHFDGTSVVTVCAEMCQNPQRLSHLMRGNISEAAENSEFKRIWGQLLDPVMAV